MTAAEQYALCGAAVEANDGHVVLQVGTEMVLLTPKEAQRFAHWLAGAYLQASGGGQRLRGGQLVIGSAER